MALKDYIKGYNSPVSHKTSLRNPKSLSINSDDINTIIWYLRIRKPEDKSCQLLHQISGCNGSSSYIDIDVSPIFREDMQKIIADLREKVKLLDVKDGHVNIKIDTNDENFNVKQMSSCIKFFFNDVLTFFGKDVEYDNILII
jgi:hypothetical protein